MLTEASKFQTRKLRTTDKCARELHSANPQGFAPVLSAPPFVDAHPTCRRSGTAWEPRGVWVCVPSADRGAMM